LKRFARQLPLIVCLVALALTVGCASKAEKASTRAVRNYHNGNYANAREILRPVAKKADENFVLNNVRLGSVALLDYDLDEAEDSFLRAYEVINSVGVNDGGRSLGAALVDEKMKIWKGEPFERAMANFYLGLIYSMRQEYPNARAAYENALFKLRDYADKKDAKNEYREQESNFAVGLLMLAHTFQKLGRDDLAKANFDRVREIRPELSELADYDRFARANVLLVVEYGYGPEKIRDNDGAFIGFSPSPGNAGIIPPPAVAVDGRVVNLGAFQRPTIDLLAMAQDRKWQDIDTIRAVKTTIGTGLLAGGAITTGIGANRNNSDTALVGLALMGSGLLLKATSQADVRQWEMLPRTVFLLPLELPPGTHDLAIGFPQSAGMSQTWRGIVAPPSGEATYYFRLDRNHNGEHTWPPFRPENAAIGEAAPGVNSPADATAPR
jgi:tetratricopeptide (TPR) repeat protein